MDIITYIIVFVIGVAIGLIVSLILWLKQLSDDITKIYIEISKLQAELDVLEEEGEETNDRMQ